MNKALISNWNQVVQPEDTVYVLGDFMMGSNPELARSFLDQLQGHKHLVLGNHDRLKPWDWVDAGFESVHTTLLLKSNIYLAHDPAIYNALPPDSILLCGHIHTLFTVLPDKRVVNVGVDVQHFAPVLLETALAQIDRVRAGLPAYLPPLNDPPSYP
jgi:calcineurin-like phosphoesterase family protein